MQRKQAGPQARLTTDWVPTISLEDSHDQKRREQLGRRRELFRPEDGAQSAGGAGVGRNLHPADHTAADGQAEPRAGTAAPVGRKRGGEFEVIFVNLEVATDLADAIAEIGVQSRPVRAAWDRIMTGFASLAGSAGGRIEELSVADLQVKLRAGIDAGNWPPRGDAIFATMAESSRPVVRATDELPMRVNRLLKGEAGRLTPEGNGSAKRTLC